jgi:MFS family permease
MTVSNEQAGQHPAPAPDVSWIIAAASFAFAVVQLDVTIVNVALPPIRAALDATMPMLQWTVDGYALSFAVLLLSAGVLSDRIGGRRTYLLGLALFALASAGCGLAYDIAWLIVARVALCLFGAWMTWRHAPPARRSDRVRAFDPAGQLLSIAALSGFIAAIIAARSPASSASAAWRHAWLNPCCR